MFDSIGSLAVAQNMRELYKYVLVDTPLAEYFSECLSSEDLDEMNIEIMRNTLYKAYLDDFNKCVSQTLLSQPTRIPAPRGG
jgi:V-type H+-transporting ATPase subunit d